MAFHRLLDSNSPDSPSLFKEGARGSWFFGVIYFRLSNFEFSQRGNWLLAFRRLILGFIKLLQNMLLPQPNQLTDMIIIEPVEDAFAVPPL